MTDVHPPLPLVHEAVARALAEDLAPLGDMTSSLMALEAQAVAAFVTRAEGVMAGRMCATEAFCQIDPSVVVEWHFDDGSELRIGDVLGRVEGPLPSILTAERTALNFLCHLSGVASLTRRFVRAAHGRATILDTRKTTPGLRALEKAAVRAGGGANHRGSLSDGVLLKDNHLPGIDMAEAVHRARRRWPGRLVEVECDTVGQVEAAVAAGASMVLLDNMSLEQVQQVAALVGSLASASGHPPVPLDVSGGVTLATVGDYAAVDGVEYISVGVLTHSAPVLDIGLDLET